MSEHKMAINKAKRTYNDRYERMTTDNGRSVIEAVHNIFILGVLITVVILFPSAAFELISKLYVLIV